MGNLFNILNIFLFVVQMKDTPIVLKYATCLYMHTCKPVTRIFKSVKAFKALSKIANYSVFIDIWGTYKLEYIDENWCNKFVQNALNVYYYFVNKLHFEFGIRVYYKS